MRKFDIDTHKHYECVCGGDCETQHECGKNQFENWAYESGRPDWI